MKKYDDQVKAFGQALRKIRLNKAYSQQKLADECDMERKTIQRIEAGETGVGLHIIFALAEVLDIAPQKIFDEMPEFKDRKPGVHPFTSPAFMKGKSTSK